MKSKIKLFSAAAVVSVLLFSCYPDEDIYYSDTDVAVTMFDDEFLFEDSMICVLFDTVMHVVDEDEEPKESLNDGHILAEIERNLNDNSKFIVYVAKDSTDLSDQLEIDGYTLNDVDLALTTTIMETDTYYSYYYPWYGYWGWYGWYKKSGSLKTADNTDYYYYPSYPYYGGGTYYAYTTGTILVDMIDIKSIDRNDEGIKLPAVWTAIMNGVLSGSISDQAGRITTQVDQCFVQSPYLNN